MGASAPPGDAGSSLFGALPEAIAQRAKPTVIVVKTREPDRPPDLRAAGPAGGDPRRRGPRWRRSRARSPPGRPLVRGGELPPLRVQRPRAPDRAQGEAGAHGQRSCCRPSTSRRPSRPSSGARSARCRSATRCSTRSSSSTPSPRTTPVAIAEAEGARVVSHPDVLPALRLVQGQGRGALEVPVRDERRHRRLGRHGRPQLAPPDGLRDARPAARGAAAAVRQGLLPAPDRRGRRAQGGRRRPGHGARRAAAHQPVLPRAVGHDPAAGRASTPVGARCSSRSRSSPATRSRSATSSTRPSGPASRAWARSTSSGGSTATRSSRACRGCRS